MWDLPASQMGSSVAQDIGGHPSVLFYQFLFSFRGQADVMVAYLNDFQKKRAIRVQYDTHITNIQRCSDWTSNGSTLFKMQDQRGTIYWCRWTTSPIPLASHSERISISSLLLVFFFWICEITRLCLTCVSETPSWRRDCGNWINRHSKESIWRLDTRPFRSIHSILKARTFWY